MDEGKGHPSRAGDRIAGRKPSAGFGAEQRSAAGIAPWPKGVQRQHPARPCSAWPGTAAAPRGAGFPCAHQGSGLRMLKPPPAPLRQFPGRGWRKDSQPPRFHPLPAAAREDAPPPQNPLRSWIRRGPGGGASGGRPTNQRRGGLLQWMRTWLITPIHENCGRT